MKTEAERMKAKSEKERKEQRRKRTEGFLIKAYQLGVLPNVEIGVMIYYTDTERYITYRSKKQISGISMDKIVRCLYFAFYSLTKNRLIIHFRKIDYPNITREDILKDLQEENDGRIEITLSLLKVRNLRTKLCCQNHRYSIYLYSKIWLVHIHFFLIMYTKAM
jgi:hypothetical protein